MANLLSIIFNLREDVLMLLVSPSLPYPFPRALPQLLQTLLELLVLLPLLLCRALLVLSVQCLGRAPFFPCKFFDLLPEEEHHVRVRRLVGVGFQEMGHDFVVSELSYIKIASKKRVPSNSNPLTICEKIILLAFGFREKAILLWFLVLAFIANKTAKHLLVLLVNVYRPAFTALGI